MNFHQGEIIGFLKKGFLSPDNFTISDYDSEMEVFRNSARKTSKQQFSHLSTSEERLSVERQNPELHWIRNIELMKKNKLK